MDALTYCRFYGCNEKFIPLMEHIKPFDWYIFQTKGDTIKTGYYTGTGPNAKRVDLTDMVARACINANIKFRAYNDAPRGGVTGNKVQFIFA